MPVSPLPSVYFYFGLSLLVLGISSDTTVRGCTIVLAVGNEGTTNMITTAKMMPITTNAVAVKPQKNIHLFVYHSLRIF